nr:putative mating-type 1-2-1 protein [Endoconidiophora laricicola]
MDTALLDPTFMGTPCFNTPILDEQSLDAIYQSLQQQQALSSAWSTATMQISPFSKVAALHSNVVFSLSDASMRTFLNDFSEIIGASALLVRDAVDIDRFFIGSIQDFNTNDKSLISVPGCAHFVLVARSCVITPDTMILDHNPFGTPIDKGNEVQPKVSRPPNAYIMYRKDRHQDVKAEFPNINNNEISRVLGKRWREESTGVREFYKTQAETYKKSFMEMYPDYRYKPRKPGERKRRRRTVTSISSENGSCSPSAVNANS